MIKRAGISLSNDQGVRALLDCESEAICFVAKAWDYHVKLALKTTLEDNLSAIAETVKAACETGKEIMLDCEHFFDGYKANPDYALACARTAFEAGCRWVILCDTNGGTQPDEVTRIVKAVQAVVSGEHLGIHAHDDTGQAVANSLAAVRAGVRQIQGTLNGLGERCGNANLTTLIPTLMLKSPYKEDLTLGLTDEQLRNLTPLSRGFDELLNRSPNRHAPYVGASAFATKAGIHASALLKDPKTYEHIEPESVGNSRKVLMSSQGGRSNLLNALKRVGLNVQKDHPKLDLLLARVKEREAEGYAYEGADASFALLARRTLDTLPEFFKVESYKVVVERRFNAIDELITVSEAVVKVEVDGQRLMSVAEGNGPVNALDSALRKDLGRYQEAISSLELVDYKVRILNGGTGAVTRVLIESMDTQTRERWFTVGVSENIVDASFQALIDSVVTKLLRTNIA
jgi:2-isopropylmalate synthase